MLKFSLARCVSVMTTASAAAATAVAQLNLHCVCMHVLYSVSVTILFISITKVKVKSIRRTETTAKTTFPSRLVHYVSETSVSCTCIDCGHILQTFFTYNYTHFVLLPLHSSIGDWHGHKHFFFTLHPASSSHLMWFAMCIFLQIRNNKITFWHIFKQLKN